MGSVNMKKSETVVKVRPGYKTHIPKTVLESIGAKPGSYIKVVVCLKED